MQQLTPKLVGALADEQVVAVAAALDHSMAVTATGRLYTFGGGGNGQLGHGDAQRQQTPKLVDALANTQVVAVAAGTYHSLAATSDGKAFSWVFKVNGRLGQGDVTADCLVPKQMTALAGQRAVQVHAGGEHSLMATVGGAVFSCGCSNVGQFGHGDVEERWVPTAVTALASQRVVSATAGDNSSLVATFGGRVLRWGAINPEYDDDDEIVAPEQYVQPSVLWTSRAWRRVSFACPVP